MTLQRKLKLVTDDSAAADTAAAIKVAFASADRKHIDQHFGAAEGFVLYQVSPTGYELLEVAQFGRLDMDGNEDKLGAKIEMLRDCVAVYCQAVGASAIGQLRAARRAAHQGAAPDPDQRSTARATARTARRPQRLAGTCRRATPTPARRPLRRNGGGGLE